jgi:hypothetical protein
MTRSDRHVAPRRVNPAVGRNRRTVEQIEGAKSRFCVSMGESDRAAGRCSRAADLVRPEGGGFGEEPTVSERKPAVSAKTRRFRGRTGGFIEADAHFPEKPALDVEQRASFVEHPAFAVEQTA